MPILPYKSNPDEVTPYASSISKTSKKADKTDKSTEKRVSRSKEQVLQQDANKQTPPSRIQQLKETVTPLAAPLPHPGPDVEELAAKKIPRPPINKELIQSQAELLTVKRKAKEFMSEQPTVVNIEKSLNIVAKISGQTSAENTIIESVRESKAYREAQFECKLAYTNLFEFLRTHVIHDEPPTSKDIDEIINLLFQYSAQMPQLIDEKKLIPEHQSQLLKLLQNYEKAQKNLIDLPTREEARLRLQTLQADCANADKALATAEQQLNASMHVVAEKIDKTWEPKLSPLEKICFPEWSETKKIERIIRSNRNKLTGKRPKSSTA